MRFLLLALILPISCAQLVQDPPKDWLKDPGKCFDFFKHSILTEQYGDAHLLLSKESRDAIPYEAFYIGLTKYSPLKHLIHTTQTHEAKADDDKGEILLCNPEFGFSIKITIKKEVGKIWTLNINKDHLDFFGSKVIAWLNHQKEMDGQIFIYPSYWKHYKLWKSCPCGG